MDETYKLKVGGNWKSVMSGPFKKGWATNKDLEKVLNKAIRAKESNMKISDYKTKSERIEALLKLKSKYIKRKKKMPKTRDSKGYDNSHWEKHLQKRISGLKGMGPSLKKLKELKMKQINQRSILKKMSSMQYPVMNPFITKEEDMYQIYREDDEASINESSNNLLQDQLSLLKDSNLVDQEIQYDGNKFKYVSENEDIIENSQWREWSESYDGEKEYNESLRESDVFLTHTLSQARRLVKNQMKTRKTMKTRKKMMVAAMHGHARAGHTSYVMAIIGEIGDKLANEPCPDMKRILGGHHVLASAALNGHHELVKELVNRSRVNDHALDLNQPHASSGLTPLQELVFSHVMLVRKLNNEERVWTLQDAIRLRNIERSIYVISDALDSSQVAAKMKGKSSMVNNHTILTFSIYQRSPETASLIMDQLTRDEKLTNGVPGKHHSMLLNTSGRMGRTPFMESVFALGHFKSDGDQKDFYKNRVTNPFEIMENLLYMDATVFGKDERYGRTALMYVIQANLGIRKSKDESGAIVEEGYNKVWTGEFEDDGNKIKDTGIYLPLDQAILHYAMKEAKRNHEGRLDIERLSRDFVTANLLDVRDKDGNLPLDSAASSYNHLFITYVANNYPAADASNLPDMVTESGYSVSPTETEMISRTNKSIKSLRQSALIYEGATIQSRKKMMMEEQEKMQAEAEIQKVSLPVRLFNQSGEKDKNWEKQFKLTVLIRNPELPKKNQDDYKEYIDQDMTEAICNVIRNVMNLESAQDQLEVIQAVIDPFIHNCRASFNMEGIRETLVEITKKIEDKEQDTIKEIWESLNQLNILRQLAHPNAEGVERICSTMLHMRDLLVKGNKDRKKNEQPDNNLFLSNDLEDLAM